MDGVELKQNYYFVFVIRQKNFFFKKIVKKKKKINLIPREGNLCLDWNNSCFWRPNELIILGDVGIAGKKLKKISGLSPRFSWTLVLWSTIESNPEFANGPFFDSLY